MAGEHYANAYSLAEQPSFLFRRLLLRAVSVAFALLWKRPGK
jgi:hypothetical protein